MKIEFSVEADTAADLLKALKNFVGDSGIGEDAGVKSPIKKVPADDPEEKPAKKASKKADAEEAEDKVPTHEDARTAIIALSKKLDWDPAPPKIQAFTKKFAKKHDLMEDDGETFISRIPQIPVKKLKLFLEAVKEEGDV